MWIPPLSFSLSLSIYISMIFDHQRRQPHPTIRRHSIMCKSASSSSSHNPIQHTCHIRTHKHTYSLHTLTKTHEQIAWISHWSKPSSVAYCVSFEIEFIIFKHRVKVNVISLCCIKCICINKYKYVVHKIVCKANNKCCVNSYMQCNAMNQI